MPLVPSSPSSPQEEAASVRLDSWKEIAGYLGRGERTAKRWESERALPVHRLPGGGRGSVYAFAGELDEWLISAQGGEQEAAGEASGAGETDAAAGPPQPETMAGSVHLTASSETDRRPRRFRHLAVYALLPVGLALAAVLLISVNGAHSFTAQRALPGRPASASLDAEKQIAHQLYLRGRYEWNKRTPDSLNRALDDFTQALVHDPGSAQTYVGLADTYNLLREYALMPENEAYSHAIAASKKAVELDDSLAEAHRALAFDKFYGNWDFSGGAKEFRRAIELNPRDPIAHLWLANAFAGPGWYPFCLREIDRAQELDPASPAILADKGAMLVGAGQTKEGLDLLKQVERTDPGFLSPHRYLANAYLTMRRYPDFLLESEKIAELTGDPVLKATNAAAREGFQRGGEHGLLLGLYAAQKKFYDQGKLAGALLAKTCVLLGKKEEALQLLEKDFDRHDGPFLNIHADGVLIALKDEPGYQQLLGKIHFPAPEAADPYLASQDSASAVLAAK
jgi:tetratricopeptide (TPR) repeat protein